MSIEMTFCPTLALRRIITGKVSQIKIPHKRHLFREIVQRESETIDKLAVWLGKKPSNVKNVITEINGGSNSRSNHLKLSV